MLYTLILKNMKSKYKDYIFYLVSSVIAVAGYIIISSYLNAMREVVKIENIKIMNNEISTLKWISYVFLFISLCFIIYTFLNYTKKKSRDYAIFIILGQKKSNLFKCIIIELLATYIVSMILGSMIGASFYHGSIYLFKKVFLYEFPMVIYPIKSYIFIYMIYFALYFISALCIYIKIRKMKLNDLLIEEQRADTLAKKGWYRFVFGIILSILSLYVILIQQGDTILRTFSSILLISIGLYFIFVSMAFPILQLLRGETKLYYKNFLFINNFVFRFNKFNKIIYFSLLSGIILLVFIGVNIYNNIYANTVESYQMMYPNDFVIESYSVPNTLIESLKNSKIPMDISALEVSEIKNNQNKNIGDIRCVDIERYNTFRNKNWTLKSGEIIGICLKLEEDFEALNGESFISIYTINGQQFDYSIKSRYWENIFGVFENYGNEYMFLMNHRDYEDISRYGQNKHIIFVNAKEHGDQNRIKQVLNDYEQQDEMKVRIYEKDKYVEINRNVILCMLIVFVLVAIVITIFKNSAIYINTFSQIDYLSEKYKAYYIMGMNKKTIANTATRELQLPFMIPVILAGILSMMYLYILSGVGVNMVEQRIQICTFFAIFIVGYLTLEYIYYKILKKQFISYILRRLG